MFVGDNRNRYYCTLVRQLADRLDSDDTRLHTGRRTEKPEMTEMAITY
jgi:hypothetical protein